MAVKNKMEVSFVNLRRQYESIKDELDAELQNAINSGSFTLGSNTIEVERGMARFHDASYAVAVNSGTNALHLTLLSLGITSGDEVITVPNSFVATAEAISYTGATPVFIDVDARTYNMDPSLIEDAITSRTKAIVPVHLFGQPADMDLINEVALKYDLKVVEDSCQAHLAKYKGRSVGSLGDAAAFSFYPSKNLGTFGSGGMVLTNDSSIYEKVRRLRNHGCVVKDCHEMIGFNAYMGGLEAAVLKVKLRYIDDWTEQRRKNAELYNSLLGDVVHVPFKKDNVDHVYHLYVIETERRDELRTYLSQNGVVTGIHYPVPIHMQVAYKKVEGLSLPVVEQKTQRILSLPMSSEISSDEIKYVTEQVRAFFRQ